MSVSIATFGRTPFFPQWLWYYLVFHYHVDVLFSDYRQRGLGHLVDLSSA